MAFAFPAVRYAAALNKVMLLDFPDTKKNQEIAGSEEMQDVTKRCLLLALLWKIADQWDSVVIDDALQMDDESWNLICDLQNHGQDIFSQCVA